MRIISRYGLLSLAVVFLFLQTSANGMGSPDTTQKDRKSSANAIAVTVNGVAITETEVNTVIMEQLDKAGKQIPPNELEENKERLRPEVLDVLIGNILLNAQAKKTDINVTDDEVNDRITAVVAEMDLSLNDYRYMVKWLGESFEKVMEQVRTTLAREKLVGPIEVSDAEAIAYYEQNKESFNGPEQVHVKHILFKPPKDNTPRAKGMAIADPMFSLRKMRQGASFSIQAYKYSEDTATKYKYGEMGFLARGILPKPIEDAAFALQPGQISEIIEMPDGFHIVKVTARRPAGLLPFEKARPDIIKMLKQNKLQQLTRAYVEKLKAKAKIVYPSGKDPTVKARTIKNPPAKAADEPVPFPSWEPPPPPPEQ